MSYLVRFTSLRKPMALYPDGQLCHAVPATAYTTWPTIEDAEQAIRAMLPEREWEWYEIVDAEGHESALEAATVRSKKVRKAASQKKQEAA